MGKVHMIHGQINPGQTQRSLAHIHKENSAVYQYKQITYTGKVLYSILNLDTSLLPGNAMVTDMKSENYRKDSTGKKFYPPKNLYWIHL